MSEGAGKRAAQPAACARRGRSMERRRRQWRRQPLPSACLCQAAPPARQLKAAASQSSCCFFLSWRSLQQRNVPSRALSRYSSLLAAVENSGDALQPFVERVVGCGRAAGGRAAASRVSRHSVASAGTARPHRRARPAGAGSRTAGGASTATAGAGTRKPVGACLRTHYKTPLPSRRWLAAASCGQSAAACCLRGSGGRRRVNAWAGNAATRTARGAGGHACRSRARGAGAAPHPSACRRKACLQAGRRGAEAHFLTLLAKDAPGRGRGVAAGAPLEHRAVLQP